MRYALAVAAVFVVAACGGAGSSARSSGPTNVTPTSLSAAQKAANALGLREVRITGCRAGARALLTVTGTAHNSARRPASYLIQLRVSSTEGKPLYYTAASARGVPPASVARWTAATAARYDPHMKCEVTSVSRTNG